MTDPVAVHRAVVEGAARGLQAALRAERPDLAWEVDVRPLDRAELARLEGRGRSVPTPSPARKPANRKGS